MKKIARKSKHSAEKIIRNIKEKIVITIPPFYSLSDNFPGTLFAPK
jgi:hypothetical protein